MTQNFHIVGGPQEGDELGVWHRHGLQMLESLEAMNGPGVNVSSMERSLADGTRIKVAMVVGESATRTITVTPVRGAPKEEVEPKGDAQTGFLWIGARVKGEISYLFTDPSDAQYVDDTYRPKLYLNVWEPPYTAIGTRIGTSGDVRNELLSLRDTSTLRSEMVLHPPYDKPYYHAQNIIDGNGVVRSVIGDHGWYFFRTMARTTDPNLAPGNVTPYAGLVLQDDVFWPYISEPYDPRDIESVYPAGRVQMNNAGITHTRNGFYILEKKDAFIDWNSVLLVKSSNPQIPPPYSGARDDPLFALQFERLRDPFDNPDDPENDWDTVAVLNPFRSGGFQITRMDVDPPGDPDGIEQAIEKVIADASDFVDETDGMGDDNERRGELIGTILPGLYAVRVCAFTWVKSNDMRYGPFKATLRIRTGVGQAAQMDEYELEFNAWVQGSPFRPEWGPGIAAAIPGGWYACWDTRQGVYNPVMPASFYTEQQFIPGPSNGAVWDLVTRDNTLNTGWYNRTWNEALKRGAQANLNPPDLPHLYQATLHSRFSFPYLYWNEPLYVFGYGGCDDAPWWSPTFFADPEGGSRQAVAEDPLPWGFQPASTRTPSYDPSFFTDTQTTPCVPALPQTRYVG